MEQNIFESTLFEQEDVNTQPKTVTDSVADNPFKNRKVVIMGSFTMSAKAMKYEIQKRGGSVETGDVTKNIHYLLLGKGVSDANLENYRKLQFNGYHVKELHEDDFEAILAGNGAQYMVDAILKKDLHLTFEHYQKKHVDYQSKGIDNDGNPIVKNRIYGLNMYLGACVTGKHILLSKMLGLVGVYSTQGLSENTNVILLSNGAFEALKSGTKHEELTLIQDVYNRSLATNYDYRMTTEEELLSWLKMRIDTFGDTASGEVYQQFMDSKSQ